MPPEQSSPAEPQPDPAESLVRVPTRRTPVTPVPAGVRRGGDGPSRLESTPVGTVDAGVLGAVDPAGLLQLEGRTWSLDWWVGAEDRWHHPGMEATVRQGPLDRSPVLETSLRVPGGEVVARVGGLQGRSGAWSGPAVGVEVENRSAVPVALAMVLRPWQLAAHGRIQDVALVCPEESEQCVLDVDGRPAILFDRKPARVVSGSADSVAAALALGEDSEPSPEMSWQADGDGRLEVALVFPLAHTATARLLLPALTAGARSVRRRDRPDAPSAPWSAPPLDSVVSGWALHSEHDPRVVAPLDAWSELVTWSANLIRIAAPAEVTRCLDRRASRPAGPPGGARLGAVAEALAGLEATEINDAVSEALVGAQRFSGAVEPADGSDATAALLWSSGAVLLGTRGSSRSESLVGPMAKAIRHVRKRADRGDLAGIAGVGPLRCAAALRFAATALAAVEQPEVAEDALVVAALVGEPAGATADATAGAEGGAVVVEEDLRGSTFGVACLDRDLVSHGSTEGLLGLVQRLAERRARGVPDVSGPRATLGFDVAELCETRSAILDAMVRDSPAGPTLLGAWSREWVGTPLEAHGLPSAWGRVSFALRWHGSRPALLWETVPAVGSAEGRTAPVLRAPGPAPGWSTTGWSGDALLPEPESEPVPAAEPEPPVEPEPGPRGGIGEGDSFG